MRTLSSNLLPGPHVGCSDHCLELIRLSYLIYFPNNPERYGEVLTTLSSEVYHRYSANPSDLVERSSRLLHPNRQAELRVCYGDELEEKLEQVARESLGEVHEALFVPVGGFGAVARADGIVAIEKQIKKLYPWLLLVGQIMRTLYGMHLDVPGIPRPGGPSFNKAFFLLEGWLPPHLRRANLAGGRTRPVLRKYWKEYRDVAHLAAAWDYFTERSTNFPIIRDTVGFLSVAQVYQEFGLSFVPLGNEDPLLDSKMVWRVPAGTPRISGALVLDTLSSEATDRLKTYRAPISLV